MGATSLARVYGIPVAVERLASGVPSSLRLSCERIGAGLEQIGCSPRPGRRHFFATKSHFTFHNKHGEAPSSEGLGRIMSRFWTAGAIASAIIGLCLVNSTASAQGPSPAELREQVNANTVTILAGNPNATYLYIATDISFVLDDGDTMRVLPIVGKGGAQNVRDLVYLRGVDTAIVRTDALKTFEGDPVFRDLGAQVRYITLLYNEEMHVLTRKDITSLEQLQGKRVNLSDVGSGTQLTTQIIFDKLGIEVEEVNVSQKDGFEMLKAGEVDATILVAGKPTGSWKSLTIDHDKFHLLPVAWSEPLRDDYLPAKLTHEDYPQLVAEGEAVDTIAVGAILAAYNWKKGSARYKRLERFVDALFSNIDKFQDPARHPKWQDTNIAARLPGWRRFGPAEEWLRAHGPAAQEPAPSEMEEQFDQFLTSTLPAGQELSEAGRQELFRAFMQWRQTRSRPASLR